MPEEPHEFRKEDERIATVLRASSLLRTCAQKLEAPLHTYTAEGAPDTRQQALVEADEKLVGIYEHFDNARNAIVDLLAGDFPTAVPREHPMSPYFPQEKLVHVLARLHGARP